MFCNQDFSKGPILCRPSSGFVLISDSVRQLILLHDDLLAACHAPTVENWQCVIRTMAPTPIIPVPIPALWPVTLASGDAGLGSIVECISFEHQHRSYAELREMLASDIHHALFTARILGHAEGMY